MNQTHVDAGLAVAAALFVLVSAMLFTPMQTFAIAIVLLALLIAYTVVRRNKRWR